MAWIPSVLDGILGIEKAHREHAERTGHGKYLERTAEEAQTETEDAEGVQSPIDRTSCRPI